MRLQYVIEFNCNAKIEKLFKIQNEMNSFYLLLELALPADSLSCERLPFFALPSFQVMKMIFDRLLCSWLISSVPEFPAFEAQETG